ncbi:hypothetical protein [Bordetella genomosp. 7]|uniref:hypothetical protein n=1 Tax=Bordetella genomosp. 7 TaxID=1416805 RepID=UPI00113FE5AB|nr:hypothetical protein [Bordetella genomosp. 7]
MNNANDIGSRLKPGIDEAHSTDKPAVLSPDNGTLINGGDGWLSSVRDATKHNLESAAESSTDFARNNPWKMMGICLAAGVTLGILIGLR